MTLLRAHSSTTVGQVAHSEMEGGSRNKTPWGVVIMLGPFTVDREIVIDLNET